MASARVGPRVKERLEKFDLKSQADVFAVKLPLGLRQRLSLACAIIHSPEMLVLDQPISGVDPVARNAFRDMLADLSRHDKVTIFISAHLMNEGMRCDRISLMHAGKVLVYDTPENLAVERGSTSLNETFFLYISEAAEQPQTAPERLNGIASNRPARNSNIGLMRRLAVSRRVALEVTRGPIRLAFAFLGSMVLMLAFA